MVKRWKTRNRELEKILIKDHSKAEFRCATKIRKKMLKILKVSINNKICANSAVYQAYGLTVTYIFTGGFRSFILIS